MSSPDVPPYGRSPDAPEPGTVTTRRVVGVLVTPAMAAGAPPGVDPGEFRIAVAEDTYEVVAGLELVRPVILHTGVENLAEIAWPGTPVIDIPERTPVLRQAFAALEPYGEVGVVVAGDAPDLPPLLIGKLFRELSRAPVAVCPASDGSAVAIAAALPLPSWANAELDDDDVVKRLRALAPGRRMVATGPGWHRLRRPTDVHRLDPGLEGWDNTRALLGA